MPKKMNLGKMLNKESVEPKKLENLNNHNQQPEYLRARGVAAMLGIHVSTCWRLVAEGKLPRPIKIGSRCSLWDRSAVLEAVRKMGAAA